MVHPWLQETREKQKKDKDGRRKFKQEDAFDIGVKAKTLWEEVSVYYK